MQRRLSQEPARDLQQERLDAELRKLPEARVFRESRKAHVEERVPLSAERFLLSDAAKLFAGGMAAHDVVKRLDGIYAKADFFNRMPREKVKETTREIGEQIELLTDKFDLRPKVVAELLRRSLDMNHLGKVSDYVFMREGSPHDLREVEVDALRYQRALLIHSKRMRWLRYAGIGATMLAIVSPISYLMVNELSKDDYPPPPGVVIQDDSERAVEERFPSVKSLEETPFVKSTSGGERDVSSYIKQQVAELDKDVSRMLPQSRYGYGDTIRSPDTMIYVDRVGERKGTIVFDTRRKVSPLDNTGDSTILGTNESDCSERAFALLPWLVRHYQTPGRGGTLTSVAAAPVIIARRLGGQEGIQEHWVDIVDLKLNGRECTFAIDSTPLNRTASRDLGVLEHYDPEAEQRFEPGDSQISAAALAAMQNDLKRVLPLEGYQPMEVRDAQGGERILTEAGIEQHGGDLRFLFNVSRFKPGDEKNPPLFSDADDYWATVTVPKAALATVQERIRGTNPTQVLNTLKKVHGIKVETSGTEGRSQEVRDTVIGDVDLMWHTMTKLNLD